MKGTATDADLYEEVNPNTETGQTGDGWSVI
jgi:hypothetical protein